MGNWWQLQNIAAQDRGLLSLEGLTLKQCSTVLGQKTICVMMSYSLPEHPSRPFLDQIVWEHSGGLVGRAAK